MRRNSYFRSEDEARESFKGALIDESGVARWDTNNQVPPKDLMQVWADLGLPFNYEASVAEYDAELSAFLADYRANYHGPSAEERAEARVAFGPGHELVNVITGHRWTT